MSHWSVSIALVISLILSVSGYLYFREAVESDGTCVSCIVAPPGKLIALCLHTTDMNSAQ